MALGAIVLISLAAISFALGESTMGGWWCSHLEKDKDHTWKWNILSLLLSGALAIFVGIVMPVTARWIGFAICVIVFSYSVLQTLQATEGLRGSIKLGLSTASAAIFSACCLGIAHGQWIHEQAEAKEGNLRGAGEAFRDQSSRMVPLVQVDNTGTIFMMATPKPGDVPAPYFQPFPDAAFEVESGKNGPLVSTTVRDSDGHIVVTISRNHWVVYPPFCQDKNYTDDALEVLDSSLHVVLQIRLLPNTVQVQGEWWDNQGSGLRIMKNPANPKAGMAAALGTKIRHNELLIQPIFKYPSRDHWQERS